jgi:hypothetical protein
MKKTQDDALMQLFRAITSKERGWTGHVTLMEQERDA